MIFVHTKTIMRVMLWKPIIRAHFNNLVGFFPVSVDGVCPYAFIENYHAESKRRRRGRTNEIPLNACIVRSMFALIVLSLPILEGDPCLTAPNALLQHELAMPASHSQHA